MNGCVLVCVCIVAAGLTQGQLVGPWDERGAVEFDRGTVGVGRGLGGILDRVVDGITQGIGGPIGRLGRIGRARPGICYRRGEVPSHDRYGNIEWCNYRYHYCHDPRAQCRIGRRRAVGTCCRSPYPVRDEHCRDGSPSAGYCGRAVDCPHGGTHYRCERFRPGAWIGIGLGRRSGVCCVLRHK